MDKDKVLSFVLSDPESMQMRHVGVRALKSSSLCKLLPLENSIATIKSILLDCILSANLSFLLMT